MEADSARIPERLRNLLAAGGTRSKRPRAQIRGVAVSAGLCCLGLAVAPVAASWTEKRDIAAFSSQAAAAVTDQDSAQSNNSGVDYEERPYGNADWLYETSPNPLPEDPNSDAIVNELVEELSTSRPLLTDDANTPAVYVAGPEDDSYTIEIDNSDHPLDGITFPIPGDAEAAPGSDHPLVVLDGRGEELRLWQAEVDHDSKTVRASAGGLFDYGAAGDGRPYLGNGVGSGLSYLSGLIRFDEVQQGSIDHALRFAYGYAAPGFRFPATETDQDGEAAAEEGGIPMGTRLYLDMTDEEIDARTVPSDGPGDVTAARGLLRMILYALRDHGMYMADGAPGLVLSMENRRTAPWGELGLGYSNESLSWIIRSDLSEPDALGDRSETDGIPWDRLVARAPSKESYSQAPRVPTQQVPGALAKAGLPFFFW